MKLSTPKLPSVRDLWHRSSGLGRLTIYLAGLDLFLFLVQKFLYLVGASRSAEMLGGWITSLFVAVIIAVSILGLIWVRRKVLWRLRNRLIVTYIFIGVIPVVLLVAIGMLAAYLFAGQFAAYVIHSDLRTELKNLQAMNEGVADTFASQIRAGTAPQLAMDKLDLSGLLSDYPNRSITVTCELPSGKALTRTVPSSAQPVQLPPGTKMKEFLGIAQQGNELALRAANGRSVGSDQIIVITNANLERGLLEHLAFDLGEVTLYPPEVASSFGIRIATSKPQTSAPSIQSRTFKTGNGGQQPSGGMPRPETPGASGTNITPVTAGSLPPQSSRLDREVLFGTTFDVADWNTGKLIDSPALLQIRTRPSLLYGRLFIALGNVAQGTLLLLAAVAVFFGLIELFAIFIGIRLTRTMTRSVYELYTATEHINRGDLSYRINVKRQDQLAALETSFNSMSHSLERLIAEQKEKQRIESELAIAQEVQSQLFPRRISEMTTLEMHGVCRPARTVSGDYYDFLPLGGEKLGIAVGDISGKGISAALLMATIHSAVRVYEMGRVPAHEQLVAAGAAALSVAAGTTTLMPASILRSPASVLALLNRHLFHSTPPEKYATMFFSLWDGVAGRLTYSNGGHLPPIIIRSNGSLERLQAGGTVVGLFDGMTYEEASIELHSGDIFLAYSDGVTEPENEFGEFGEHRLIELVRAGRSQSLSRISDDIVTSVLDWIGAEEQPDDITVVLARAK